MLQKLNERIQGVIAWVVISLIAVTFALFGIDYYIQSHHDTSVQVEVDEQPISTQEFELSYRRTRQQRDPAQLTPAIDSQIKKQVMQDMILNKVSMKAARMHGFEVNAAQAESAILGIPQFQEEGHFSSDRYQQVLSGAMYTPDSFTKEVRQGMLLNQQRFAFMGTAFALPNELQRFVKLYMQTRDYNYLVIPATTFLTNVSVSENDISDYYQQHQKEFLSKEQVSIDYIRLSMQDIKSKINITDEQLKRYYDENKNNYLTPAQWQVASISFAIPADSSASDQQIIKDKAEGTYQLVKENPSLFDQKVAELSDDKLSVMNKGVLPWITAGQSEFDSTLINLTKPEQISPPVKSKNGYQIFKLLSSKPAATKPFTEVKADIQEQLLAELAQTKYAQALEQLNDLSYQTPDSLAPVAQALKLAVEQSPPFSRSGSEFPLGKNKQLVNAAFNHDVLELGNNSEAIQVDNDSVIVLRVNKHIPAAQKSLAEVKALISEKLGRKNANSQAKALGDVLVKASQDLTAQEKLVRDNHLKWQTVAEAPRETDKAPEPINQVAFNLPRPGENAGVTLVNGDYVVVSLKKINDGDVAKLDKEQVASITQQIEANYGAIDYDLYVSNLLRNAKIVKH